MYNQCLWNNSFIVTQGNPIFNLSFINKGILKVSDILNDSSNLLSWQLSKSKYNLDNKDFMSRIELIESTSQRWKKEIKLFVLHSAEGYSPCNLRREPFLTNLTVNETYKTLVRLLVQHPTAQKSIKRVLQRNYIDWATVYYLRKQQLNQECAFFSTKF